VSLSKSKEIQFWLKVFKRNLSPQSLKWSKSNFSSPSPQHVKIKILKSHAIKNATWVETGTYLGDTTSKLAKIASKVISIEPQIELSTFASTRLKKHSNVEIVNATSESSISGILERISGPACFWLDGHYSGDVTFQGTQISPILAELSAISKFLETHEVVIFVDDFRLFVNSKITGYPPQNTLVNWANDMNLSWTIEHDIFIANSKGHSDHAG
jgi:hypothetical protein